MLSPYYLKKDKSRHSDGYGRQFSNNHKLVVSHKERWVIVSHYSNMINSGCCPGDVCVPVLLH